MSQIIDIFINRFDGGMSEDKRDGWVFNGNLGITNKYSITRNYDVFTYPKKLVPFGSFLSLEDSNKMCKFIYCPTTISGSGIPSVYRLHGFGAHTDGTVRIYRCDVDSGVTTFSLATNGTGTKVRNEDVFFYYKGYIYLFSGGDSLSRYDVGQNGFTDQYQAIDYSNVAQPVHHLTDDCAYFFANNVVYRLNNTTWDGAVLTLPPNYRISGGIAFGNYLGVFAENMGNFDVRTELFLWDRDSSLATVSKRINCGNGKLRAYGVLRGSIIIVIETSPLNNDFSQVLGKYAIRKIYENSFETLNELTIDTKITTDAYTYLGKTQFIEDNKLYFPATLTLNGDTRHGIFIVDYLGRISMAIVNGNWTSIQGIYKVGNTWYVGNSNGGATYYSSVPVAYGLNIGEYETLIFNAGDSSKKKDLVAVTLTHEPLPASGSLVLAYRKDNETSWTNLLTSSTENSIHASTNASLPKDWKEIQLKVTASGKSVLTSLKARVEITGKDIYE